MDVMCTPSATNRDDWCMLLVYSYTCPVPIFLFVYTDAVCLLKTEKEQWPCMHACNSYKQGSLL